MDSAESRGDQKMETGESAPSISSAEALRLSSSSSRSSESVASPNSPLSAPQFDDALFLEKMLDIFRRPQPASVGQHFAPSPTWGMGDSLATALSSPPAGQSFAPKPNMAAAIRAMDWPPPPPPSPVPASFAQPFDQVSIDRQTVREACEAILEYLAAEGTHIKWRICRSLIIGNGCAAAAHRLGWYPPVVELPACEAYTNEFGRKIPERPGPCIATWNPLSETVSIVRSDTPRSDKNWPFWMNLIRESVEIYHRRLVPNGPYTHEKKLARRSAEDNKGKATVQEPGGQAPKRNATGAEGDDDAPLAAAGGGNDAHETKPSNGKKVKRATEFAKLNTESKPFDGMLCDALAITVTGDGLRVKVRAEPRPGAGHLVKWDALGTAVGKPIPRLLGKIAVSESNTTLLEGLPRASRSRFNSRFREATGAEDLLLRADGQVLKSSAHVATRKPN